MEIELALAGLQRYATQLSTHADRFAALERGQAQHPDSALAELQCHGVQLAAYADRIAALERQLTDLQQRHTETMDANALLRRQRDAAYVPLAYPAARAYLDVAIFHPFPDGNARLAMLTLAYVLELEGVRLDQAGPLQTTRYADDAAGAADLAALVSVLIRSTHHRATRARH